MQESQEHTPFSSISHTSQLSYYQEQHHPFSISFNIPPLLFGYIHKSGGSGIAAFLPIIEAALRNPRDKRKLRLLCLIGGNRNDTKLHPEQRDDRQITIPSNQRAEQGNNCIFEETLREHVQLLHVLLTKDQIEENRFEAVVATKGCRFDVDMLMPWFVSKPPSGTPFLLCSPRCMLTPIISSHLPY